MPLAGILDRAESTLGEALPRLGGAVLLLLGGLVVAWVAGRLTRRALLALGADELGERWGIHDVLARVGAARSLSRAIGTAVRLTLVVAAVVAAVSLLGLGALGEALSSIVLFVPKVFVALALVLAGLVLADVVGDRADRTADQMALGVPLGQVARLAIIALFGLTALAQLGVPTTVLLGLAAVVVAAGVLTVALAFGLGGRDVARQVSAGRYVGSSFRPGQRISVAGVSGEIVSLEAAATVVRRDDGASVRVPNHLLVESVVVVESESAQPPG